MTEIVFAFNATSSSSDHYLGLCRIPEEGTQLSIIGSLVDAIRDATGEEYAYLEQVELYTDNLNHQASCRNLASELIRDFQSAYTAEQP
jgi:hypothetical protein